MKVRLLVVDETPFALAQAVLAGLGKPFAGGDVRRLEVPWSSCLDRQRSQVDAAALLALVPPPAAGWNHLAVTDVDLFLPALTYVFGVAHLGGHRALASWARLRDDSSVSEPSPLLVRRMLVEAVHELGHGLGLVHCPVPDCPMHRSMWVEQVDLKGAEYCQTCLGQLQVEAGRSPVTSD